MRLRMVQTITPIFLPEAGGGQGHYLHDKTYDLTLEGAFVRVTSRGKNRISHRVPLSNVACIEDVPLPANETAAAHPPVKKAS